PVPATLTAPAEHTIHASTTAMNAAASLDQTPRAKHHHHETEANSSKSRPNHQPPTLAPNAPQPRRQR
ncbi:MAG: hypothetical protein L0H79_16155, partial [Intrasporangium sp.]|uniref:hypothetical protein n=1 Tax=Intrasporangium sp. TaxID=1925024 RepID=UPI002649A3BA